MTEPLPAGIDLVRHATVRRRIDLVKGYLAGERSAERRERAAAELGVTPGQFLRLVRIWRETGSPEKLHGAGAPGSTRKPARSLPPETEAAIAAAINDLGTGVPYTTLVAEIERRCDQLGIRKPAGSTVWDRLNRRRGGPAGPTGDAPTVTILKCSLRFPVDHDGGVARPSAVLAVLMPEGIVAAAEIGLDGVRTPDLPRLVRRLVRLSAPDATPRPLLVEPALLRDAAPETFDGLAAEPSGKAGQLLSRLFGQRLGPIPIRRTSLSDRTFRERAAARLSVPPRLPEATTLLLRAIEAHNRARAALRPEAFRLAKRGFGSVGQHT